MDNHLKKLFTRYNEQFGSGPGLGPGSGTCLMNIENISPSFIRSLYKAAASLYRTDPWKRFQPDHLFGLRVGKDSDWPGKKQPFPCIQFIGKNGGDLALYMFRSETDAKKSTGSRETIRIPNLDIMRITYESESLLFPSHKKMIKSLSLEISGTDRYPIFDICRCNSSGELRFRNPTIEELRFIYGVMKSVSLVHSLLQENNNTTQKWSKFIHFDPFIETVDVQFPSEISKGNDIIAVTISHPPSHVYTEKVNSNPQSTQSTPTKKNQFTDTLLLDLRKCAHCDKEIPNNDVTICDNCKGVIFCDSFCQKQHWKESHKPECGLYKAMMEREEELRIPTFTFLCSDSDLHPCKYLESIHLHRKGMWRRKCPCFIHYPFGLLPTQDHHIWGGLNDHEYPPEKSTPKSKSKSKSKSTLSGWVEYYNLRSLPLSSPVAHILSHPLTVYYILTTLSITTKNLFLEGKNVILHYIGPEDELDWIPTFSEIDFALNGRGSLQIVMIGPKVPSCVSGSTFQTGARVRVDIVKGVYEEELGFLPRPDLVVGLNCGFESCSSWSGALEAVKSRDLPGFFTDQSEVLCGEAKRVVRGAGLVITHPVTPNPFRSPVRNYGVSSNLPSYSNGFVFGVNT